DIRTRHAAALASTPVDLVTAGGGQAFVWLPKSGVGLVLADAGVTFGAASSGKAVDASADDLAVGFKGISFEQLGTLRDAKMIITSAGLDGKPAADTAAMLGQRVFKRLPAAEGDQVHAFGSFFPFSYGQALSILDDLDAALTSIS